MNRRAPEPATERSSGQGGYMMLIVLVAIGFFSLLVVALLGLIDTDNLTTTGFARSAAVRRAADGALEVGVTRLKTATAASISQSGSCAGTGGAQTTIESRVVTTQCEPIPTVTPSVASTGGGGTVLTLLGNYNGTLDDGVYNQLDGLLGPIVANVATNLNSFLSNGPGLVHLGPEPLAVVGDVKVRQSTLGIMTPISYPAIDVNGSYQQGDAGLLGNLDLGWPFTKTPACGLLTDNLGTELGLRLRSTAGTTCALGRDNVAPAAGPVTVAPASWTSTDVAAKKVTLPTCAANSVVKFTPGSYSAVQTTTMNGWFQQGNCDNVTFWFPPGDYYFDASGYFGTDPSSLVLNDVTSNWVFGAPNGWVSPARATSASFPEACDRTQEGVSITLSNRTAIKHRAGQVAICGRHSGTTSLPAIYQQVGGTNQTWAGEPGTAVAVAAVNGNVPFTNPTYSAATIAGPSPAPAVPADYPTYGKAFDNSEGTTEAQRKYASATCSSYCAMGLTMSGFAEPTKPAPSGTLTRAVLRLRGSTTNVQPPTVPNIANPLIANNGTHVKVEIAFNDGSGQACSLFWADIPRSVTTSYDVNLLVHDVGNPAQNTCYGLLRDAMQLENASITVYEVANPTQTCFLVFCNNNTETVKLDYGWLETTTSQVLPPSPITMAVAPSARKSFNVFGPVFAPSSQVEVTWAGDLNTEPIFVGGLVARGLASQALPTTSHVGVLAAQTLAPGMRHVRVRAETGGRLMGTAEVTINDTDVTNRWVDPGRTLTVNDWKYCNLPTTAASTSC